ncbi:MAG: type I methionyl aminopeptidase [Clostridiales bacterium]|jgi:methionyl aminopeptidase|nr:type I methionyl aminopeptidase [Clostridiales bacterium]
MAIPVKNASQIELVRESARIVAGVLDLLEDAIKPGVTTAALDRAAEEYIKSQGAWPSFKGYDSPEFGKFPASICASVNEQVIHGIPGKRLLQEGDIIGIDVGAYKNGFHADAARTFGVGALSPDAAKLIEITRGAFFAGIAHAKPGCHLHDISRAIDAFVTPRGYGIVREFIGHGVGRELHEEPQIPHYTQKRRGPLLYAGMTLAVEPMITQGSFEVEILKSDGWTVVTKDRKLSAHYENTVLITGGEPEILTLARDLRG